MSAEKLNSQFGIPGQLAFVEGKGGFVFAEIQVGEASAVVSTYAGQILSFKPNSSSDDLFFVSDSAYYASGKAIKGGVPICWPWFGPDPKDQGRPGHGYVRNCQWEVSDSELLGNGGVRLVLTPNLEEVASELIDAKLDLSLQIDVSRELEVRLVTKNIDNCDVTLSQGLHSYFMVGDINQSLVLGLEDCAYIDKLDHDEEKVQKGGVKIQGEVDRIYLNVPSELILEDEALNRRVRIKSMGSESAVVWNPWLGSARKMADLGDDDYLRMLCVETTNAGPDVVALAPGEEHVLAASYSIEND